MSNKLKILHILTALSILLWIAADYFANQGCGDYGCGMAGIVYAPLILPSLVLVPITIIADLTILGRKVTSHNHKRFASRLIPITLVSAIVLVIGTMTIVTYRQDHYSVSKAVKKIQNCEATGFGYSGGTIYLHTTSGETAKVVSDSGQYRLSQAVEDASLKCNYDPASFVLDY